MPRALLASLLPGLLLGCTLGPRVEKFPLAKRPEGAAIAGTTTRSGSLAGELLEVRAGGLLLLLPPGSTTKRLVLVPYPAIREARFPELGKRYDLKNGQPPATGALESLRRASRFPQGLSEAGLRGLLDACRQNEVEQVPE